MANMHTIFERMIDSGDLPCVDRVDLPARPQRLATIPERFRSGAPGQWLMNDPKLNGKLWLHQAKAMRAAAQGKNVIVSTGTASGKSLIFQSVAFRTMEADSEAVVMVFYPLKALANDQWESWRNSAEMAGFNRALVDRIDGSVPRHERAKRLRDARIVLMTPDVCHAWLMQEVSNPDHAEFISRAALIVIDEAHTLEGVFGSNFAYLFRRICAVRSRILQLKKMRSKLQVIAASATIRDPDDHLHNLTGLQYVTVSESDNGSPRKQQSIVHIQEIGSDKEVGAVLRRLVDETDGGSFIAFRDSRQGTERLALQADAPTQVKPYRSGYESEDRTAIEEALRQHSLRGVVSTSALELGIDIPHFSVGLNMGVPPSRKSFRQRLGRVGRRGPGVFGIVAPSFAFNRFGMTLMEYYQESVELSYLYLRNRFMQYAHARCLAEELEMLGMSGRKRAPGTVSWPDGFSEKLDFAYAGSPSARPREYDQIDRIGSDQPHLNYPLRGIAEDTFTVGRGGPGGSVIRFEQLSLQQAVREAFPGAIYLSRARAWSVQEWRNNAYERTIRVTPTSSRRSPKPLIRTYVNLNLEHDSIVEGHLQSSNHGVLAECHLQITERVEGYQDGDERLLYRNLRQTKRGMTPKTRDFRTTGVVLRVGESWFTQKGVKETVADALRDLIQREYSISPNDVGSVSTNVSEVRNGRRQRLTDTVVLFDATHGSLRLTEPAYTEFEHLLQRLGRSVEMTAPNEHLLSSDTIQRLREWYNRLDQGTAADIEALGTSDEAVPEGWLHVFEAGSVVAYRDTKDQFRDITITGRQLMQMGDRLHLVYTYQGDGFIASIPAERVEAVGDDWNMVYWNPKTDECRESFDESPKPTIAAELGPSPYIVGNPVDQEKMFYGRAVIMDKIKRQLGGSSHANVILLEGNRRTGKTSILRQLNKKDTPPGWVPVYCSLQDVDSITTADVFRLLTLRTGWTLADAGIETWIPGMPRPASGTSFKLSFRSTLGRAFSDGHPFETLELYLSAAIESVRPLRILLMLDEFDKLQEGIERGITSQQVPENIRHLLQHQPGIGAIITGSRRLKRLRKEYWSALFGFGYRMGVSALPREEAERLVTEPVAGRLDYDPRARDRVVDLCACHPFLVQSLCSRVFDQAATGSARSITVDMVERAASVMVQDNEHFHTLWGYAGSERRRLILALCASLTNEAHTVGLRQLNIKFDENGISIPSDDDLADDVTELRELEMLEFDESSNGGIYRLSVPLMAAWIETNVDFQDLLARASREAKSL